VATDQSQNWVITGAAGTLGQALVQAVTSRGHECVAVDKNLSGLEALHDSVLAQGHLAPALYAIDLVGAKLDDYEKMAEAIERDFGHVHHLVHLAAGFKALRPLLHQPPQEWMEITHLGIHSALWLTQAIMPHMVKDPQASITFVNGRVALEQKAHWGAYGLSQAAREWMGETLARELGPKGPTVRVWHPPMFYSEITAQAWPATGRDEYESVSSVADQLIHLLLGEQI
jgi:NAD(P)-dependent dehydrogenase (short-subunit alcohol dehydrogenase family)